MIAKESLKEYINSYNDNTFIDNSTDLKSVIEQLCEWQFNNFFLSRWESLKYLYKTVRDYKNSNDFANRINEYFADNKQLENIISNQTVYEDWFKVFYKENNELFDKRDSVKLKDQVAKYIVSFQIIFG